MAVHNGGGRSCTPWWCAASSPEALLTAWGRREVSPSRRRWKVRWAGVCWLGSLRGYRPLVAGCSFCFLGGLGWARVFVSCLETRHPLLVWVAISVLGAGFCSLGLGMYLLCTTLGAYFFVYNIPPSYCTEEMHPMIRWPRAKHANSLLLCEEMARSRQTLAPAHVGRKNKVITIIAQASRWFGDHSFSSCRAYWRTAKSPSMAFL